MEKDQIFKDINQWKGQVKEEMSHLSSFFFQPLLKLANSHPNKDPLSKPKEEIPPLGREIQRRATDHIQNKNSIGSFLKTKLSERHGFRSNITMFRGKHEVALTSTEQEEEKVDPMSRLQNYSQNRKEIRKASSTL